jgi:HTH-type transcriptional regulator/antitoxin HigA
MEAKIIRTEEAYDQALDRILALGDPEPHTAEGDEYELLLLLVEDYEEKYVAPIPEPDPVDAITYIMEERGLRRADFGKLINSKSHATEILDRKRPLSLKHIRLISEHWNLPAELLIKPYPLKGAATKTRTKAHAGKEAIVERKRTSRSRKTSEA